MTSNEFEDKMKFQLENVPESVGRSLLEYYLNWKHIMSISCCAPMVIITQVIQLILSEGIKSIVKDH